MQSIVSKGAQAAHFLRPVRVTRDAFSMLCIFEFQGIREGIRGGFSGGSAIDAIVGGKLKQTIRSIARITGSDAAAPFLPDDDSWYTWDTTVRPSLTSLHQATILTHGEAQLVARLVRGMREQCERVSQGHGA